MVNSEKPNEKVKTNFQTLSSNLYHVEILVLKLNLLLVSVFAIHLFTFMFKYI